MTKPALGLLVLRSADIEASRAFYETLGLEFVSEQHGSGPVHYSCEMGGTVIEIFPAKPGTVPDRRNAGATLIGFRVSEFDQVMSALRSKGTAIITEPQESTWGWRAVVQDPDGRAVELTAQHS